VLKSVSKGLFITQYVSVFWRCIAPPWMLPFVAYANIFDSGTLLTDFQLNCLVRHIDIPSYHNWVHQKKRSQRGFYSLLYEDKMRRLASNEL
jgi:hypothetical protein